MNIISNENNNTVVNININREVSSSNKVAQKVKDTVERAIRRNK